MTRTTPAPDAASSAAPTPSRSAPHVLREYALLADGERGVVVGPRGDFAWLCFPRWDDDAVLAALLGGGGSYELHPSGRYVWGGYYEPGTLIWRSRWVTDDAIVECREALALPARADRAVVLRRVIMQRATAPVEVGLDLRGGFGAAPARDLRRDDDGTWRGRAGDVAFAWSGGPGATVDDDGALALSLRLEEGACHDFVLVLDAHDAGPPEDADALWQATEEGWRRRVPNLHGTSAARDAIHAYAVLSGLTSASGGMVAAATTSLPERARAGRNYDYRYAWIRDQCYAGQAAARSDAPALLDEAVSFVGARLLEHGPDMSPAYTVNGKALPDEHELPLPGYPGGGAKVGNWVNGQFQLDAFGEALLLLAAAAERDRLDADGRRAALVAAEAIEARWREPDAGVWELDDAEWTHSRLLCVAGLRAIADHAAAGTSREDRWRALAERILDDAGARLVHPSGRWQRAAGDRRVDAALLLGGIRGATAPDDPRAVATLRAVADELCVDGYAYRFRPDERPLGEAEGAFLLCGFLMALALDRHGDHVGAARWFERNRAACGPPGLLSEEYDVRQRQMRGNLPQAFVHALLLECAVTLEPVAGA